MLAADAGDPVIRRLQRPTELGTGGQCWWRVRQLKVRWKGDILSVSVLVLGLLGARLGAACPCFAPRMTLASQAAPTPNILAS